MIGYGWLWALSKWRLLKKPSTKKTILELLQHIDAGQNQRKSCIIDHSLAVQCCQPYYTSLLRRLVADQMSGQSYFVLLAPFYSLLRLQPLV